jgi:hypothetical protein
LTIAVRAPAFAAAAKHVATARSVLEPGRRVPPIPTINGFLFMVICPSRFQLRMALPYHLTSMNFDTHMFQYIFVR